MRSRETGLDATAVDATLADYGRLPTEREVLRALWAARKELVRSEIHRRMPYAHRPTLGRVGQILAALHDEQLLVRSKRKAQGSQKAGFYALSETGRALCRDLGFERQEKLLFSASERMLRDHLTRERLSWRPPAPGRIITTYSYRGGLGRTTMVAHVARGLAEVLPEDQKVLVMDLDLGAPGLDEFFAREGLEECRGLGGMLVDYERLPTRRRSLWLRTALRDPIYALQPSPEAPNLMYLPSGIGSTKGALSSSERAEAMSLLQAEAVATAPGEETAAASEKQGFLAALREALLETFARTVVDSEFGNSLGAWVATLSLADELVLCMADEDTSDATIAGLRSVLGNFVSKYDPESARGGGVLFLFRLKGPKSSKDLDGWIEDRLILANAAPSMPIRYRTEQLPYNVRLVANRRRKKYAGIYRNIIAALDLSPTDRPRAVPPEAKALLTVLDPDATSIARSLSGGLLEEAPLEEIARLVDWYVAQSVLPAETDDEGDKLIRSIVESHSSRLVNRIVRRMTTKD